MLADAWWGVGAPLTFTRCSTAFDACFQSQADEWKNKGRLICLHPWRETSLGGGVGRSPVISRYSLHPSLEFFLQADSNTSWNSKNKKNNWQASPVMKLAIKPSLKHITFQVSHKNNQEIRANSHRKDEQLGRQPRRKNHVSLGS